MNSNQQIITRNNPNIFTSFLTNPKEKPWWLILLASILIVIARILLFD